MIDAWKDVRRESKRAHDLLSTPAIEHAQRVSLSIGTNSTGTSAYWSRVKFALSENLKREMAITPGNWGFLTLTVGGQVNGKFIKMQCRKTANKRWNSLRRHLMEWLECDQAIIVIEQHKDGAWHYHLAVRCGRDIRRGFDFAAVRGRDYRSANRNIRKYWRRLRRGLHKYGFGRAQLEPVKVPKAAGAYLAKYIAKAVEGSVKGERYQKLRYLGRWEGRMYPRGWSWVTPSGEMHRLVVKAAAALAGIYDFEDWQALMVAAYGSRWCGKLWKVWTVGKPYKSTMIANFIFQELENPQRPPRLMDGIMALEAAKEIQWEIDAGKSFTGQ